MDYGNSEWLGLDSLRPMRRPLAAQRVLATECCLPVLRRTPTNGQGDAAVVNKTMEKIFREVFCLQE